MVYVHLCPLSDRWFMYTYVLQVIGEEIQRSKNLFTIRNFSLLHENDFIDNSCNVSYYKFGFIPVFSVGKNQNKNTVCTK